MVEVQRLRPGYPPFSRQTIDVPGRTTADSMYDLVAGPTRYAQRMLIENGISEVWQIASDRRQQGA